MRQGLLLQIVLFDPAVDAAIKVYLPPPGPVCIPQTRGRDVDGNCGVLRTGQGEKRSPLKNICLDWTTVSGVEHFWLDCGLVQ